MKHTHIALTVCVAALAVLAQPETRGPVRVPHPLPSPVPTVEPHAVARFCGNHMIAEAEKIVAFQQIQAEGCENVSFVHVKDGQWLAYGTKVLVAGSTH